jgi:formylglycine-generating enzyme required for sulfatase activity
MRDAKYELFAIIFLAIPLNLYIIRHRLKDSPQRQFISCQEHVVSRRIQTVGSNENEKSAFNPDVRKIISRHGMTWIKGGFFSMGSLDGQGKFDEYPIHRVKVNGFWMDASPVTNLQFQKFVQATGYVTTAERKPVWEELEKQLPGSAQRPEEDKLVPASLVFFPAGKEISLDNPSQWWSWIAGADWKHPQGPGSTIAGKENYPVVQVSWFDANAYAKWAHKRLPTEAEWEYAARGGLVNQKYSWGSEEVEIGKPKANTWQGQFPNTNSGWDGYNRLAPVNSFQPNGYGLYDMAGNVWEWCQDWYSADYYRQLANKVVLNPKGPAQSFDPDEPDAPKRVVRGGSFLCNASYCAGYRVAARMKTSPDTGLENTGFRCVSAN